MFILVCSLSMSLVTPGHSQTTSSEKIEYLYPANKEKVFAETADEFYQALRDIKYPVHQELYQRYKKSPSELETVLFREMSDASINIRKKLLFNEVERLNYITWDGNILYTYPNVDVKYHQTVSPDRQVYFFYSLKDTEEEFRGRYAIYDVETKETVAGGFTYMPKSPTYKENLDKEK